MVAMMVLVVVDYQQVQGTANFIHVLIQVPTYLPKYVHTLTSTWGNYVEL